MRHGDDSGQVDWSQPNDQFDKQPDHRSGDQPNGGTTGGDDRKTNPRSRFRWIPALIILALAFGPGGISIIFHGTRPTVSVNVTSTSSTSQMKPAVTPKEGSGTITGSYETDTAKLTVDKAVSGGIERRSGRPIVVVYFTLENTGNRSIQLNMIAAPWASQHGLQIPQTSVAPVYDTTTKTSKNPLEGYDVNSNQRQIAPRESASIQMAFAIVDPAAPVTFSAYGFRELDAVSAAFTVSADAPMGAEFTRIPLSDVPKPASVQDSDLKGFAPLHLWDGKTVHGYVQVVKVERGRNTYRDEPTVAVTYQWVNKDHMPMSLTDMADVTVQQDGGRLNTGYVTERAGDPYVANAQMMHLDRNCMATITVNYLVQPGGGDITVTIRSAAEPSSASPAIKKTYSLPK